MPEHTLTNMTDTQSFQTTLKDELTKNLSVSVLAVLLALPAAFLYGQLVGFDVGGYLLLLNVGVYIPYAYERHWPVSYAPTPAIVWTVSAALVTTGVFLGAYQIALSVLTSGYAAGVAFVVTVALQYGSALAFRRARGHA